MIVIVFVGFWWRRRRVVGVWSHFVCLTLLLCIISFSLSLSLSLYWAKETVTNWRWRFLVHQFASVVCTFFLYRSFLFPPLLFSILLLTTLPIFPVWGISFFKLLSPNLKELEFPSTSPISLDVQVVTHLADFLPFNFLFSYLFFSTSRTTDLFFLLFEVIKRESHSCLTSGLFVFYLFIIFY